MRVKDQQPDTKVTIMSMGPEGARDAIKHSLAMGADEGVLLTDGLFADLDWYQLALVLSTAVKKLGDVDLVVCGRQAVDWDMGVTGSGVAELLGWPALTIGKDVKVNDGTIAVEGEMTWVRLKSAGGSVRFLGSAEDLVASSVSGAVGVDARRLARARVETVTGGVRLAAMPDRTGSISVESHAGTVELLVPPGAPALFELATLGGTITNGLTATRPHPGPGGRGQELSFGTDPSGAVITARTFKGDILVGRTEGLAAGKK